MTKVRGLTCIQCLLFGIPSRHRRGIIQYHTELYGDGTYHRALRYCRLRVDISVSIGHKNGE